MEIFMTPCEDKDLAFALLHHLPSGLFKPHVKVKTRAKYRQHQPASRRANARSVKL